MNLTTTVSVALVLFLVGLECVVLLSARRVIDEVRQNLVLTVVMRADADTSQVIRLDNVLAVEPYCFSRDYISKQQALQEHIASLGEDPVRFLGYNPLADAFEVHMVPEYACADSVAWIEQQLKSLPYVDRVIYQQDIIRLLDRNVNRLSFILMAVALILLLTAVGLIVNTIRLQIYSKRFLINTMRLVGATPWVIRAPFIRRNILLGVEAGILALLPLAAAVWYCFRHLGVLLFALTWQNIAFVAVTVVAVGVLMTFFASLFATDRYIRMKTDKLYEI